VAPGVAIAKGGAVDLADGAGVVSATVASGGILGLTGDTIASGVTLSAEFVTAATTLSAGFVASGTMIALASGALIDVLSVTVQNGTVVAGSRALVAGGESRLFVTSA
jgi:hypothetical protein